MFVRVVFSLILPGVMMVEDSGWRRKASTFLKLHGHTRVPKSTPQEERSHVAIAAFHSTGYRVNQELVLCCACVDSVDSWKRLIGS